MKTRIPDRLRELVNIRANFRCEYCLLHRDDEPIYAHEVDHVIAEKHLGQTVAHNLAFACFYCNRFKGTDIASIDPLTGTVVPLFNPRTQSWHEYFALDGPLIIPLTPVGRATVQLLQMNRVCMVQRRTSLIQLGRYPS